MAGTTRRRWARPVSMLLVTVVVAAAAVVALNSGLPLPGRAATTPELLFVDDFHTLDKSKWLVANHASDVNEELQYYTPANVKVRNGMLALGASRRDAGGRKYTSGLVSTAGRFSFTYGTVKFRAKAPSGDGLWSALWMLGEDCAETFQNGSQLCPTWPAAGSQEIDVMEYRGSRPTELHMAHHHNTEPGRSAGSTCDWQSGNLSGGWHTYGITWTPGLITWTLDGIERCRMDENVPDQPMFLVMNLAVGGFFGGAPSPETRFPQEMRVDWVRVLAPA